MMTKLAFRAVLLLPLLAAAASSVPRPLTPHDIRVLDGDTILVDGSAVKLAGFDAPELGPWAKCWAEAALAGHSKDALESKLHEPGRSWSLAGLSTPDSSGKRTAHLLDAKGYDAGEELAVSGHAARTDARWDWCGANANLHSVGWDEKPPHGPNLWWPSGSVYDARAGD
jgi:endonuclease YncB( thermonuclease family)